MIHRHDFHVGLQVVAKSSWAKFDLNLMNTLVSKIVDYTSSYLAISHTLLDCDNAYTLATTK